jgi:hypothetical protein
MQEEQHAILLAIYSITKQEELVRIVDKTGPHPDDKCKIKYSNGHIEIQPIKALIY